MRIGSLILIILFGAPQHLLAQSAEPSELGSINTARPSFSSASTTLETGHWQWEGGYQYTKKDDEIDTDSHTLPSVFLRLGVNDNLELNLAWAGYTETNTNEGDSDGVSDLSVGLAYQLTDDASPLAIALFSSVSLPVGSDDFTSDEVDPSIGLAWSYSPTVGPGLFGTVVLNSVSDNDERASVLGAAIGASLAVTEQIGSYIEYFGVPSDSDDASHSLGAGVTYLVRNNVQLDINGGIGLNDVADDYFVGAGIGWRF